MPMNLEKDEDANMHQIMRATSKITKEYIIGYRRIKFFYSFADRPLFGIAILMTCSIK